MLHTQNSQQKSVPDLHVYYSYSGIFSPIKNVFSEKKVFFTFFQCNFSVQTLQCFQFFFAHEKLKNTQKSCSESTQTPFSHSPAQATAHSPKLTFRIINMSQDILSWRSPLAYVFFPCNKKL